MLNAGWGGGGGGGGGWRGGKGGRGGGGESKFVWGGGGSGGLPFHLSGLPHGGKNGATIQFQGLPPSPSCIFSGVGMRKLYTGINHQSRLASAPPEMKDKSGI